MPYNDDIGLLRKQTKPIADPVYNDDIGLIDRARQRRIEQSRIRTAEDQTVQPGDSRQSVGPSSPTVEWAKQRAAGLITPSVPPSITQSAPSMGILPETRVSETETIPPEIQPPLSPDLAEVPEAERQAVPGIMPTIEQEWAGFKRGIEGIAQGYQQFASDTYNLLANIPGLMDKAAQKISDMTGLEKGGAFEVAEEALRDMASNVAPDPEIMKNRDTFMDKLYRAIGRTPGTIATYAVAGKVAGPIAGMAIVDALRESDKGVVETALGAIRGGALGGVLHAAGVLKQFPRALTLAGIFGSQAAVEKASPEDIAVSTLTGLGLGAMGGRGGVGLKELYRKLPTEKEFRAMQEGMRKTEKFERELKKRPGEGAPIVRTMAELRGKEEFPAKPPGLAPEVAPEKEIAPKGKMEVPKITRSEAIKALGVIGEVKQRGNQIVVLTDDYKHIDAVDLTGGVWRRGESRHDLDILISAKRPTTPALIAEAKDIIAKIQKHSPIPVDVNFRDTEGKFHRGLPELAKPILGAEVKAEAVSPEALRRQKQGKFAFFDSKTQKISFDSSVDAVDRRPAKFQAKAWVDNRGRVTMLDYGKGIVQTQKPGIESRLKAGLKEKPKIKPRVEKGWEAGISDQFQEGERGELTIPRFGQASEGIREVGRKIYHWLDVQAPFVRAGAERTGIAVKNYSSMKIYEQERALWEVGKSLKKIGAKPEEGAQILIQASKPKTKSPTTSIERSADVLRKYFDEASKRLQQDGVIKYPWPESVIQRNIEEIASLNEAIAKAKGKRKSILQEKKAKLTEINNQIKAIDPKYVHIPLNLWFGKIYETLGQEKGNEVLHRGLTGLYKGRFFRQRKTIDMERFINWLKRLKDNEGKPIFEDADFDVRSVVGSYAQKVGTMRGLARIFQAAKTDRLLIPKARGRPEGYGEAPLMFQIRFPELRNYYIHNAFNDYVEAYLERVGPSMQLGRIFGYTKMMQFYNPFFLPVYDLWQGSWLGSMRTIKAPALLYRGFKSVFTRDKAYWRALEDGAFSTPFSPPFQQFLKEMKATNNHRLISTAYEKMGKTVKTLPLIDDFYRIVWNMAWKGDHAIRMASYHYLIKKGYTSMEAAQTVAHFHGDYARLTPQARRILNKIFFTPSFKFAMGHLQANMVKSAGKVIFNAARMKKSSKRDMLYAKGLLALVAGSMAKDLFMKLWGFKTDDFGLRYSKKIIDDQGNKKELVLYWPDPNNAILRQGLKWSKWGDDPDRLDEFMRKGHWDLHPLWQTAYELFKNQSREGKPIWNPFDDEQKIATDIFHYSISRIVAAQGAVERLISDKDTQTAYKAIDREFGFIWAKALNAVTLAYLRNPKETRIAWKMRKLQRIFKTYLRKDKPKDSKELEKRTQNFFDQLREIEKE